MPPRPAELIARGLLRRPADGAILLCQNLAKGYFYLPGGHVDPGESAAEALAREFLEESDLGVRVGRCLAVAEVSFGSKADRHHEVNLVFHVEHSGPTTKLESVRSQEKSIGFSWFSPAALSDADLRPDCLKRLLISLSGGAEGAGQSGGADPAGFSKVLWVSDLR